MAVGVSACERQPPGQHLVEQPRRADTGPLGRQRRCPAPARGDVVHRAHDHARGRQPGGASARRTRPKSTSTARPVVAVEENVGRFHVAVDQPGLVGCLQAGQALLDQPDRFLQGNRLLPAPAARPAIPLRRTAWRRSGGLRPRRWRRWGSRWDGHLGRGGGLGVETLDEILLSASSAGKTLMATCAVQRGVVAPVDVAHAAAADAAENR